MVAYRSKTKTSRGTTLVELLAVLAIIAMMAAVAVPIMMKAGFFASDRRTGSARELYAFLRAAKVYAAANNVSTAVVYPELSPEIYDEQLGIMRHSADVVFMARRMSRADMQREGLPDSEDTGDLYIPLQSRNGNITPMTSGTCMFLEVRDPDTGTDLSPSEAVSDFGLKTNVSVWDPDNRLGGDYSAHVFKASGQLETDNRDKERFVISVGLKPEEDPNDRFFVELDGTLTENLVSIELYRSTGRIKISG
jgi:prepilin-type N-terminal cleavage/methylation domain-containing protein